MSADPRAAVDGSDDVSFLAELKRRKVVRVGIAYGAVSIASLEAAGIVFPAFFLPDSLNRLLVLAALIGFPVALVLAWVYDLTAKGIRRTSATGRVSARFTSQLVVAGAVVVLAMTGIGWHYMPSDRPDLVRSRIAVAPFENRTGDAALDPVGVIVADHIVRSLVSVSGLEAVPVTASMQVLAAGVLPVAGGAAPSPMRAVAEATRSGVVITGSYHAAADSIVLQATVHDADGQKVIFATEPVRAQRDHPDAGLERLREGLFGFLAMFGHELNWELREGRFPTHAPSYAAYKEYAVAMQAFVERDWQTVVARAEAAAALDSSFVAPLLLAATAQMNAQRPAAVAILVDRVEAKRAELSPSDRAILDWARFWLAGDLQRTHDAAVRMAEQVGTSPPFFVAGTAALQINRPAEALEHFRRFDLERVGPVWPPIWVAYSEAYHRLGRHRTELRLVRKGRAQHPDNVGLLGVELSALAALGRGDRVQERFDEIARSIEGQREFVSLEVARELEAHGDPANAERWLLKMLDRLDALPDADRADALRALLRVQILAGLRRDEEARELAGRLLEVQPGNPAHRLWSAALAARVGDRAAAEEAIEWYGARNAPYIWGRNILNQAHIAAELGDAERAVRFLETAYQQGAWQSTNLHTNPHYHAVRDHPAFRAFLKPKD